MIRWAKMCSLGLVGVGMMAACANAAEAQDSRTVTEPVVPPSCVVLPAQQGILSGEPTTETSVDTATVQAALTACPAGQAVDLSTSGGNNAFLIGPITIPGGVTLLVDGGVTVFGSRNPADYQVSTAGVETCGTVGTAGNGCKSLITMASANSAIMGYGVIDGRGQDKLIVNGTAATFSWWDNAGFAQKSSGSQNNPILVSASGANAVFYRITFRNSPMFHVKWTGNLTNKTGFTAWGVKVATPFSARNTDGIDPSGLNISVLNSWISDGDDNVAVSASSPAQNITIANVNTYSGHGISVGSITKGGLTNMLVQNITQMGTPTDSNGIGIRIKAQQSNGGLVQNVTYQNICSAGNRVAIYLSPYYSTSAGTSYPSLQNITYRNIHVITEGLVTLQGYSNTGGTVVNPSTITLDNVVFDTLLQKDFSPAEQNLQVTVGPGPVSPLFLSQTGTNVSFTGSVTSPNQAPYPCSASQFQYLVGELFASNTTSTNLQTETLNAPTSVTLNAIVQPAMSQVSYTSNSSGGSYTGTPAPTAPVQFVEGTTIVGTGTLGGNGTIASLTIPGVRPGVHTYKAQYAGDATYTNPLNFGSVTVNVVGVATKTTVTTTGSTVFGGSLSLVATVTPASGTNPTGTVQFLDGTTILGTATVTNGSATLPVSLSGGIHNLSATYQGDTTFGVSTSSNLAATITPAASTTSVTASATAINPGASTVLTVTVAGVPGAKSPGGTLGVTDAGVSVGAASLNASGVATVTLPLSSLGSHTLTVAYSGDINYNVSAGTIALAVVQPFSISATNLTTSLAPGAGVTIPITVAPAGGFSGSATMSCTSPVVYVTCSVAPTTVALSGNTPVQVSAIITVAPVVGSLRLPGSGSAQGIVLAVLLLLGVFGFARRRSKWRALALFVVATDFAGSR